MLWIEWSFWIILLFICMSWSYGIRSYVKNGTLLSEVTVLQTFCFWFILITFLFIDYSKIHIIWISILNIVFSRFLYQIPIVRSIIYSITSIFLKIVLFNIDYEESIFLGR